MNYIILNNKQKFEMKLINLNFNAELFAFEFAKKWVNEFGGGGGVLFIFRFFSRIPLI